MSQVAIVTDSAANLPADYLARYAIHVVPILLHLNRATFRDGVDLAPGDFYQRMNGQTTPPTTSAPSVGDFLRVYASLAKSSTDIVSVHLSGKMSSTYLAARTASELVDGVNIHVLDCGSAAMGQGFVVLEAARAAERGAPVDEIIRRVAEVSAKVDIIATLSDLRWLVRSGRVPAAVGLAGSLLRVCPIFRMRNGEARPLEVQRTREHARQRVVELVAKEINNRAAHIAVFHGQTPLEAAMLRDAIVARVRCVEYLITEFPPAMGAHTGPDVLGVAFFAEDETPS